MVENKQTAFVPTTEEKKSLQINADKSTFEIFVQFSFPYVTNLFHNVLTSWPISWFIKYASNRQLLAGYMGGCSQRIISM